MSMLSALPSLLVPVAAAAGEEHGSGLGQAIAIGVSAFVVLLGMLIGLMAFGKGRDHS